VKRVFLLVAAAIVLWIGGRALIRALASDETKIRRLVETMADGFDRTRMDPILQGLSKEFVDETSGATRQELREALAYLFFTAKDETTKAFPYRAKVEVGSVAVHRPTAECAAEVRFVDLRGGMETPAWEIGVRLDLERGDEGWKIVKSRYETRSGRMLR
jgi:hypothetical protein